MNYTYNTTFKNHIEVDKSNYELNNNSTVFDLLKFVAVMIENERYDKEVPAKSTLELKDLDLEKIIHNSINTPKKSNTGEDVFKLWK